MHVLLFGGSFDPPHHGHQKIVKHVLEKGIADQVWYVPCRHHPFEKPLTDPLHRLAMLQCLQQPHTTICIEELSHTGKSYTIDTLRRLSQKHPDHRFSWLIGSDQLADIHRWKNIEEILKHWRIFVYPRAGFPCENKEQCHPELVEGRHLCLWFNGLTMTRGAHSLFLLSDMPSIDISSTDIRQKCKEGRSIAVLVDSRIARYIERHGLYTVPTTVACSP